jgi:NitT/TauT family transport system substrate-binding protein
MARAKLTTFSKLLIVFVVLLGLFFGFQYLMNQGIIGGGDGGSTAGTERKSESSGGFFGGGSSDSGDPIKIGVVTWGGYAGGQYFNEGFKANAKSRFKKEYGLDVEFVLNDDVDASLNAWKSDEIDLHWYTIDAFPTILPGLADFDPVVLFQADWSRGGDAIVARRGINSVADLKGKTIAVAEQTPSHSFLIWLLDAGGLKVSDVKIVPQISAVDAAAAFKSQQVDAAVVWSPDDELSVRAVPGSRILESTRNASNIIADIFFAKRSFVENNRDKLEKLYEGWMKGAAEINGSQQAKQRAAEILADGLGLSVADAMGAIDNVRLVTHGDNKNFFGLNPNYRDVTGESLYARMGSEYRDLGFLNSSVPNFRSVSYPQLVTSAQLTGNDNAAESAPEFTPVSQEAGEEAEAIATKSVSISFRTGEFNLDPNAQRIIDLEFVPIAQAFGNARIRIEGNTDNVGNRASNVALSKKRADAVRDYLVREYKMSPNRFVVVGNGPDKPVASNSTAEGRAQNRRTDFELIRE